ncbi:MAG: Glu-tRNA(Gln) amidotransferase subunit GatD [Candidatus ainarchaeum sp.]|nr:Glu-tRNA(Gln) amidotransferase subunit GatD [Candidatus ainarchaeum sp.]
MMVYSAALQEEFRKKGIKEGDRIRVAGEGGAFEGLMMPRPHHGDAGIIVLKLDNGYNIGIRPLSVALVSKSQKVTRGTEQDDDRKKGDIAILGCGGTIASRIEYETGAVYPSISPQELRATFPALERWPMHARQLFALFSEDLNVHHWRLLADEIEKEIKGGSDGVVVMHGTDTMAYTSAAISFMLQNLPIPVVFVGAQRSSDRPSSDNEINLLNSVFAATHDFGEVGVCMHADTNDDYCHIHRGTRVRKMHTSRRDAFKSINSQPLFAVDYRSKRFDPLSEYKKRSKEPLLARKNLNPNVGLVYTHPNIKPEFIAKLDIYDGVVLMATGLGQVPTNSMNDKTVHGILPQIKGLISSGIPVVISSQTIYGRVCMRVYSNGRLLMDAGAIGDGADWTPETAYAKLCWVLGQTKDMKKVGEMMMTDYAGEISVRSEACP